MLAVLAKVGNPLIPFLHQMEVIMKRQRMLQIFSSLCLMLLGPVMLWADGVIVPVLPPELPIARLGNFYSVQYHRVHTDIQGQAAVTTVEQAFSNELNQLVEVQYVFPLPRGSVVSKFSLTVEGREIDGKIMDKAQARQIYENIVRRQRDPALLEYIGEGMFQTNVFPLPAKGLRSVKLVYTELLTADNGLIEYRYPLNTEKFSKKVLGEVRVEFSLSDHTPLKNVYSPTHNVRLTWDGDRRVKGHWADENVRPANDFRLFWKLSDDRMGATLFTYRPEPSEDGYFLFLASPQPVRKDEKILPKDLILVIDVSGSMAGEKIEQARKAGRFIVERLNPDDHFNVIFYSSSVDPVWDRLQPCGKFALKDALSRIDKVEANGSTNIHEALTTALKQFSKNDRPGYLIFLTDGLPTAGTTDLNKIAADAKVANKQRTRLFAFGVGYDVNAVLLDRLGADNFGLADYVPPGQDMEDKVSSLYSKIQSPALTDPSLDFGGVRVRDSYPQSLPDVFHGSQLVLTGRYRDTGSKTITLTGKTGQEKPAYSYNVNFAERTDREEFAFVARLWAQKKIGALIEQIRLNSSNQETIDEIVALSTRYGIMTQYTSFLAQEDVDIAVPKPVAEELHSLGETLSIQSGSAGVSQSMQSHEMQALNQTTPEAAYYDRTGTRVQVETVKIIGAKTFFHKPARWQDSQYKEGMKLTEVKQLSEEFIKLAGRFPDQAQYLTFAPHETIIAVIEGVAYRFTPAN